MRGAWIEMLETEAVHGIIQSLPMRGAWIEIVYIVAVCALPPVAPHAGSVD